MMSKEHFIEFWSELYLQPHRFFTNRFTDLTGDPPYFALAVIVFGMGAGIDRLDTQFVKMAAQGRLESMDFLNAWIPYWLFAAIAGTIGGYLWYLIGSWFFNVRLQWSKGPDNLVLSRHIYLFSGVVSSAVLILITFINMFLYEKPYVEDESLWAWDLIVLALVLFFSFYSVYVSYIGARTTGADAFRSRIWFLILPCILLVTVYATVIALAVGGLL